MKVPNSTTHNLQKKSMSSNLRPATIALCLCTFTQAYLLISVFPYAGYMVIHLFRHKTTTTITQENAGTYAGILSSSFMVGRFLGSYPWGKCADLYGRTFVLKWSLLCSGIASVGFGFSSSFTMALIFRFVLGLVNSIIGTTKTVVSEISHLHDDCDDAENNNEEEEEERQQRNKKREAKMMGLVVGMRGWGYLMAPALGGLLSEPLQRFPHSGIMRYCSGEDDTSICHWIMSEYPFVLPNIIGMILCFVTALAVYIYIDETLPMEQRRDGRLIFLDLGRYMVERMKKCFCCNACILDKKRKNGDEEMSEKVDCYMNGESESLLASQTKTEYSSSVSIECEKKNNDNSDITATISIDSAPPPPLPPTMRSIWSRPKTRHHLESYGLFSFVVTCVDEAFPLYCISQTGGLGLSEQSIGSILSGAGLLFAMFQYGVYSIVVSKFGLYQSLKIGCLVGTIPVLFIPVSIIWKAKPSIHEMDLGVENEHDNSSLNWKIFIFLVLIMATSKIFCCLFFASISVAMNQSVPISSRGTMNGIATLMGSMGKGLGPMFSGWLVAFCISSGVGGLTPKIGSVLIFVVICVLGILVYFGLDEKINDEGQKDDNKDETEEGQGKQRRE